ncbi:MAG TPA: hypothetical protein VFK32_04265 [Tepidiformaceae bacterium]|nr:hypothetical protein [Tepidiformaceae bacterium]
MRDRLWVAGVIGGLAAMVVLAAVVLKFGIKDPSPPSLVDDPNPEIPGQIAYIARDVCIRLVEASGSQPREVTCLSPNTGIGGLIWLDERHIAVAAFGQSGIEWTSVDVSNGDRAPVPSPTPGGALDNMVSPRGEELFIEWDSGDVFRLEGGDRIRIFDFDGPDNWAPEYVTWSPDGEWVLLRYGEKGELWIVRRDGSFAGTLTDDVSYGGATWWIDGLDPLPPSNLLK